MKKLILSATLAIIGLVAQSQQTAVNLSMGSSYTDEVYYKLSTAETNIYTAASWDIAFLRVSNQNIGIRINDGIGIQVFEAANTAAAFNNIDIANEASWTSLYNDDTHWDNGAFMQGSASYGWGEYNPATHHVQGTIVFVLKYADGTYRKFINEDYFGGYTFKYATWNGSAWVGESTVTISNNENPTKRYNYYSFKNNTKIIAEPDFNSWDFVFRKYNTFLDPPGENYVVTGTLQNLNISIAKNEEPNGIPNLNGLDYLSKTNTIGHDWKSFDGAGYSINSDMAYYIKYNENTVYRLVFSAFEGSSTGNLSFNFEDVSDLLGLEEISEGITFGIYPNPSTDKIINVIYDLKNTESSENNIDIYDLQGGLVFSNLLDSNSGFFNKMLDLSALQSGLYIINLKSGKNTVSKKLILN